MLQYLQNFYLVLVVFAFFCTIIVLIKGKRKLPMVLLSFSNLTAMLGAIFYWMLESGIFYEYPHFLRVPAPFLYLLGPISWLFTRTLLYGESRLRKTDWLHFMPFILHIVELTPFYLSDAASKLEIIKAVELDRSVHLIHFKEGLLESKWHTLLKLISIITYFGLSVHAYLKVKGKIKTDIIVDYNRIFTFLKLYLFTRLIGILLIITSLTLFRGTPLFSILLQTVNLLFLVNVFVLIFAFPEFVFGEDIDTVGSAERENLVKTLMSQTLNLRLLQRSSHEANVLFDSECRVMYCNKHAERKLKDIYGIEIELNTDFRRYLDPASAKVFQEWFNKCLQGETVQVEEKSLLHDNSDFTWLQISFTAHYNELGKLKGVSVGANSIDDKKRMAHLQEKYVQRLDELAWDSSHLLRAPVANMKGIIGLIAQKDIQLSQEEKEQLISHMSEELNDLDQVIKDMVGKARKELEDQVA